MITKRIYVETDPWVDEEFQRRFGIPAEAVWVVGVDVMDTHGVKKISEIILQDGERTFIWKPGQGLAIITSLIEAKDVVWATYTVEAGKKITYDFKWSIEDSLALEVVLVEDLTDDPL